MRTLRGTALICALVGVLVGCGAKPAREQAADPAAIDTAAIDQARRALGSLAVSADNTLRATFAKNTVTIMATDGRVVASFAAVSDLERPPADFSPDGHLFAISGRASVYVYDLTAKNVRALAMDQQLTLRFSANGKFVAGQGLHPDTRLAALSVAGDGLYLSPDLPAARNADDPGQIWTAAEVAIANDGKTITAVGQDGSLLWETSDSLRAIPCGCEQSAAALDRSGTFAAYLLNDGTVSVWNLPQRREIFRSLSAQGTSAGGKVRFTEDGRLLLTVSGDGREQVWSVPGGKMVNP